MNKGVKEDWYIFYCGDLTVNWLIYWLIRFDLQFLLIFLKFLSYIVLILSAKKC